MWKGNFGAVENSIKSVSYRFKKASSTDEDWVTGTTPIEVIVDENGKFSFSGIILGDTELGFDIANVYIVEVTVTDELSTVIYTMNLGSGRPHVAYARNGVAIMGKYDEELSGALQVYNGLYVDGKIITPDGTIGNEVIVSSQQPTDNTSKLWINPDEIESESVEDIISNEYGTSVKYKDGRLEFYGIYTFTVSTVGWGSLFATNTEEIITFPISFKEKPSAFANCTTDGYNFWCHAIDYDQNRINKIYLSRPVSVTNVGVCISYLVKGRWK